MFNVAGIQFGKPALLSRQRLVCSESVSVQANIYLASAESLFNFDDCLLSHRVASSFVVLHKKTELVWPPL